VVFDFADVTLPYRPGWPLLTDADGHMAFVNQQYHVEITEGSLGELAVDGSRVSIFDLDEPKLQIAVARPAPLGGVITTLEQTPLVGDSAFDWLAAEGPGRLDLDVLIGLSDDAPPPSVSGQYTFGGNRLSVADERLVVEDLAGKLRFTGTRFTADNLAGTFLGRAFRAQVAPRDGAATRIRAQTRLSAAGVQSVIGPTGATPIGSAVFDSIDGVTDVDLQVDVPHGASTVDVRVDSRLAGWQSALPAPFDKPAGREWPLRVDLSLASGALDALSARLETGDTWRADLDFAPDGQLASSRVGNRDIPADVAASGQPAAHRVGLRLDSLALGPWLEWWASIEAADIEARASAKGPSESIAGRLWLDARLGRLRLGDWWMEGVSLGFSPRDDGWWLGVSGDENRGELRLSDKDANSPGKLEGRFDRLRLHRRDTASTAESSPAVAWDLAALPSADLSVADLHVDDMILGQLALSAKLSTQLTAQPDDGDYRIDRIDWRPVPTLSVTGSGRIENGVGAGPEGQQTQLSLTLEGDDVGQAISAIHGDSPIQGGSIKEGALSISWPGSPSSFAVSRVAGHGQFTLEEGQLRGIDPGAGRLVGLMSLGALTDRLRLDFRDVTREGLYFESLAGRWHLDRGRLTVDALNLTNPSLRAFIDGNIDLVDRRLDLVARVYADFGMLLPLIGTVAGGPLVGGAVLAIQETVKQLDQATEPSVTYHIGGSFDAPEVLRVEVPAPAGGSSNG